MNPFKLFPWLKVPLIAAIFLLSTGFSQSARGETIKEIADAAQLIADVAQGNTSFGQDPVYTKRAVDAWFLIVNGLRNNKEFLVGTGYAGMDIFMYKLRPMTNLMLSNQLARGIFNRAAIPIFTQANGVAAMKGGLYAILFMEILYTAKLAYELGDELDHLVLEIDYARSLEQQRAQVWLYNMSRAKYEIEIGLTLTIHQMTQQCLSDKLGIEYRPACQYRALQDPMVKMELESLDQKQKDIQAYAAKNAVCMGDDTPWSYIFKQRLAADDLDGKIESDSDFQSDSENDFSDESSGGDFGPATSDPNAPTGDISGGDFGSTTTGPSAPTAPSAPQGTSTPSPSPAPEAPSATAPSGSTSYPMDYGMPGLP